MGQYYKPTILTKRNGIHGWWYSHECAQITEFPHGTFLMGSGLKLMEHSWRKNPFVSQVVEYLYNNPQRLVWAGDYAEPETKRKNNVYFRCADNKKIAPKGIFKKVGDDEGIVCDEANLAIRYIVNHSKNQYVDLNSLPKDKDGWQIHALPLLTAEGNGQGGGDYWGADQSTVGTWARDLISSCSIAEDIPHGFKKISPKFKEKR
jgi:hypothetical protein